MEYAPLGAGGPQVSRVGFGCWAIGGHGYGATDDAESVRAVREALARGITLFDTADVYGFGHSEEVLSEALGADRHRVVVATKFGVCWDASGRTFKDSSAKRAAEALEGSLRRLRLECIPLYQIHYHDGTSDIEETLGALARFREAGKILHIGCSNLGAPEVERLGRAGGLSSVQLQFGLGERRLEGQLRRHHGSDGLGTLTYGALARGLLSGKYGAASAFGPNDTRSRDADFRGERLAMHLSLAEALRDVAGKIGKTPAQVAVRWVLDAPFISSVLVGMKSPEQAGENAGAAGWSLSPEDWGVLSRLSGGREA